MPVEGPIFISYKSQQRDLAVQIRNQLRAWGYEPWLDIDRLQPGTYWANDIDSALKNCGACVAVMTPTALASRYVTNEWDMAIMLGKLFIPLMFETTDPHYKYVDIQYIDFTGGDRRSAFALLQARLDAYTPPNPRAQKSDPYHEYLGALFQRINTFLSKKVIRSLSDDANQPEPIRLEAERVDSGAAELFDKREEIDPLFALGGIADEPVRKFTDFAHAFEHFERRMLLLGEPGAGKTTSLLHAARDAVVKRRLDSSAPLPILGIIPTWDPDKHPTLTDWLAASYGAPENAANVINEGRALLLLDGLDELGSEGKDAATGEPYDPRARFLSLLPDDNDILLTCRAADFADMRVQHPLNGAITLKPLTEAQMQSFLRAQPELLAFIMSDPNLRHWLDTPLLLSFFASAYEGMSDDEREELRHLTNAFDLRDRLYALYVQQRYEHEQRKPNVELPFSLEDIYTYLGNMALMIGRMDVTVTGMRHRGYFAGRESQMLRILSLLNLLIYENGYRFIHPTMREYFAYFAAIELIESYNMGETITEPARWLYECCQELEYQKDPRALPHLATLLDVDLETLRDAYVYDHADAAIVAILKDIAEKRRLDTIPILAPLLDNHTETWGLPLSGRIAATLGQLGTPDATALVDAWMQSATPEMIERAEQWSANVFTQAARKDF